MRLLTNHYVRVLKININKFSVDECLLLTKNKTSYRQLFFFQSKISILWLLLLFIFSNLQQIFCLIAILQLRTYQYVVQMTKCSSFVLSKHFSMALSLALRRYLMVVTLPLLFILQLSANYGSFFQIIPNTNPVEKFDSLEGVHPPVVHIVSYGETDPNILEEKISEIEFQDAATSFQHQENQVHSYLKGAEKPSFYNSLLSTDLHSLYDLYCAWKLDC